jgi:hypothetical protein
MPFTPFVSLRVVLNILVLVDDSGWTRFASFDALQ